jgi:inorganic pyrophosphatase
MFNFWRDFPSGPDSPNEVYVVTEITRGSRNKYEYDARRGIFKLNRVLYTYFPCDYGFVPHTLDDDGDPLDAVLLINEPTFTGCFTVARPVANIKMMDEGAIDDKVITISTTDPFYKHIRSLADIPQSAVDELTYFFNTYKQAEGKATKVLKWEDVDEARKLIVWAEGYYKEHESEL